MKVIMVLVMSFCFSSQAFAKCMIQLDTAVGPDTFAVDGHNVMKVSKVDRQDKTQAPISCWWVFCKYPKVEATKVYMSDATQLHVFDTMESMKAKMKPCMQTSKIKHHLARMFD